MIYECTDCAKCASFVWDYRIFCMAPELPPDKVCDYQFLGQGDARDCPQFSEGFPQQFTQAQLDDAFSVADDEGQTSSYGGVRKWLETHSG